MKSSVEELSEELRILEKISGIIGTAIVNRNGLLITSRLPRSIDKRKFGAMASFLYGATETATNSLQSNVNNLAIQYENSRVIIMDAGKNLILAVLLEINMDLGLLLIEIEGCINKIKNSELSEL